MDLSTDAKALGVVRDLFDTSKSTAHVIPPDAQKPVFTPSEIAQPFPRATPESQGVPSALIADYIMSLRSDTTLDPQNLLILRNGVVIAETGFGAFSPKYWHITHSECKSITGIAIGMLIDEGKLSLDDSVSDLLKDRTNKATYLTHKTILLRHLLNMTSGIAFNEMGSITELDWVRCFFESLVLTPPGKTFNYNSMNTYMLSAIVKAVSGQGLTEYLTPRLFQPMGITNFYWEKCPMGTEKGGWGLYILPEDIAKIGQMLLNKGMWNGQRLLSEAWVEAATGKQADPPEALGNYDYGYQIWVGRGEHSFLFNGMFAQNVLAFPDNGLLIVSNDGNNELFQQSNFYPLSSSHFAHATFADEPLPETEETAKTLHDAYAAALREPFTDPAPCCSFLPASTLAECDTLALCKALDGRKYLANDPHAPSTGVFPLFSQVLQNDFTEGVRAIAFVCFDTKLLLSIEEADETHLLPVGFDAPCYAKLSAHGETHAVAVNGRFTVDEENTITLKLRISLLETASSRMIKILFYNDRIETYWSESPGVRYLTDALASLKESIPIVKNIIEHTDEDILDFRLHRMMEPKVIMQLKK